MRICYIADGISIHTQRWLNYFATRGHEVHLISWRFPSGYEGYDKRIEMHSLIRLLPKIWKVSRYVSGVLWLFELRKLLKRIKPDVLDAHFITICGYLGVISGFHPVILTAWGSDILIVPNQNPAHRLLTKQALKMADYVICCAPVLKEETIKLGVIKERISVAFKGVDIEQFSPNQGKRSLLQEWGINSRIVISTRALSPLYDVETLVRAIPLVLEEVPEARFVIIGEGKQKSYLENLVQSLGIQDKAKFVGWISHDKLPHYLASSDVYVSTSLSDGTSESLLEAVACGLPPVVTDIAANQPWVTDGENGFLFPMKDYQILATKITCLLTNEDKRAAFGQASRRIVIERANHETEMAKVEQIYERVLSMKGK